MPEIEDIIETTETAPLLLWWQWAIIIFVALVTVYFLSKWLNKKATAKPKINNLKTALQQLVVIENKDLDDNELAIEVSMLTREYLRHQLNNQSLFQTHQEFVADHEDLERLPEKARTELAHYLEVLANHKYLPDSNLPTGKAKLINYTETLLREIDSILVNDNCLKLDTD